MISFQNFTSDPHGWLICGCCGQDLPLENGKAVGAWVQVGSTIVSIVCDPCEKKMIRSQPAAKSKKKARL